MAHNSEYITEIPGSGNGSGNDTGEQIPMEQDAKRFTLILYQIVVPILYGLTTLIGIIGNSLVIYVILSRRKMRTVTNILLLNLAFADLLFSLVVPTFTAYVFAASTWSFGPVVCKMMHYLVNLTAYVTVYTLVLVSVIRYLTIVHNVATARFRTKFNIIIMIIMIWVVFLLLNIPVLMSYGVKKRKDDGYDCDHHSLVVGQRLFSTFFVFAYFLPLLVIGIFSICILLHLRKQRPSMLKKSKSDNKKKKAGRLLIMVVIVFAVLWLPVHIHLLVYFFGSLPGGNFYAAISVLFNLMAYFNACVNPIIYNHASKEFRDAFREVMFCVKGATTRSAVPRGVPDGMTVTTRLMSSNETNGAQDKLLMSEVRGNNTMPTDEV